MKNWLYHLSQSKKEYSEQGSETPACDHVWFWVMLAKQALEKDKDN